jgi:chromosome segregation ATPase
LQSKITDLDGKLAASVPRSEADELRAGVVELEGELSKSVPKIEADVLLEKANRLEAALTQASEKLGSAETRMRDLECKLAESIPKADSEARVVELQARLSESKSEADALKERAAGFESKVAEAERQLEAARIRIRQLEEASTAKSPAEEKPSDSS